MLKKMLKYLYNIRTNNTISRAFNSNCYITGDRTRAGLAVRHFHHSISSNNNSNSNDEVADFGFREVNASEKEHLVKNVFSNVASKYDVMNDLMSGGTHRLWKDEVVSMIGIPAAAKAAPSYVPRHLDVAGGTGDIAFRSLKEMIARYGNSCYTSSEKKVVVCDINPDMLAVGRQRALEVFSNDEERGLLDFVEGNAENLPFDSDHFDIYTIAFGLRNVTNKQRAIEEAYRVLRRGGRMMILEFSHIDNAVLSQIYDQFSFKVIPKMGEMVANDSASYQYLVESIRKFPKQEELQQMMEAGGFRNTSFTNFTFGVVAVHSGFKI